MKEEWKGIEWYEWLYQVSNLWRVKSLPRLSWPIMLKWKILKSTKNKNRNGYYYIMLYNKWERKNLILHRLVAQAFIKKIEWKDFVNHIDCNVSNNTYTNLEWCTQKENIQHSIKLWNMHQCISNWPKNYKLIWKYDISWNLICTYKGLKKLCETEWYGTWIIYYITWAKKWQEYKNFIFKHI